MDYWFFLSYARSDASPELTQFFKDLAAAVKPRARLSSDTTAEQIGFIDRSGIEVGDEWPDELREGLLSSRVMVTVLSRSFLASDVCGKELEVFRRRLEAFTPDAGDVKPPPLALPVLWDWPVKIAPLPERLARVQFEDESLGARYKEKGLRTLASQTRFADEYREFVDMFAERLVAAAEPNVLPRVDVPAVEALPSAFRSVAPAQPATLDNDLASMVYLVGTSDEMAQVRQDVTRYAPDCGWRWRPFAPDESRAVHVLANRAAVQEDLASQLEPFDEQLLARLEEAEKRQRFVLLIVDPWSTKVDRYRQWLTAYDQRQMLNVEVLVISNGSDAETALAQQQLLDDLYDTFERTVALRRDPLRDSITSAATFERQVIAAISDIRKRLMQGGRRRAVRRGDDPPGPLPMLSGPGGA